MNVFKYEQNGLLLGLGLEQRQHGCKRSILLLLRGQFEWCIASPRWDRQ